MEQVQDNFVAVPLDFLRKRVMSVGFQASDVCLQNAGVRVEI